jgi:polyhydroxyalkanoate synthesis regulator phasin
MTTSSSVRISTETREAIGRLAAAREQTAGALVGELVAEAERADEDARRRSAEFLKSSTTDDTIFDLEVLRTVREHAWPIRKR